MNRRNFLKAAGAVAGAFMVPELIVPDKRFWALDRTMVQARPDFITLDDNAKRFLDAIHQEKMKIMKEMEERIFFGDRAERDLQESYNYFLTFSPEVLDRYYS